jgi:hypothetical protein
MVKHICDGGDGPEQYYFREDLDEIERRYGELSPEFRKMRSWTKVDLANMAEGVASRKALAAGAAAAARRARVTTIAGLPTRPFRASEALRLQPFREVLGVKTVS